MVWPCFSFHSEVNDCVRLDCGFHLSAVCWHANKDRPPEEGIWSAGTPPLPLQSWELSPSAASSPWQPKLAQSLSTNLYHIFLAYNDCSYPYFSHILFRRQALERPRLEWGTETMNTISCSKGKKKKKEKKMTAFPLYTGFQRRSCALYMPVNVLLCLFSWPDIWIF